MGVGMGTALGVAFDNIALGVAMGTALGVVVIAVSSGDDDKRLRPQRGRSSDEP